MSQSNADQELKRFKQEFEKASKKKDRTALESMIHDEFTLVDPSGNIVDKQQLIDGIVDPKSTFADSFSRKEHKTTILADGSTARETADVSFNGKLKGKDISGQYINSATYVKGSSGWQLAGNTLMKK